jgi:hypothetical protein
VQMFAHSGGFAMATVRNQMLNAWGGMIALVASPIYLKSNGASDQRAHTSRSDGSLRNQVGKYKSIALDHFSRAHRDGAREYRCIIYECVKFSILPAWIDSRRQSLQQL